MSQKKRRTKAVPVLGVAGLFSLAGGAAGAATGPTADVPAVTPNHQIVLGEEELSDVSLATFYVFDKENRAASRPGLQLARGCGRCGGCGGCHGCRGCGRGCGCAGGCGGCGGCGCACCWWWGACAPC